MNDPENKNHFILNPEDRPVFFIDEMTKTRAEKAVFRNQRRSFGHGCQGKNLLFQGEHEGGRIARTVSGNIGVNLLKIILGMPGKENPICFWHV